MVAFQRNRNLSHSLIVPVNDIKLSCPTHKCVDDTTLTEMLTATKPSRMDSYLNNLAPWSVANHMQINKRMTKEMVITTSRTAFLPLLPNMALAESSMLLGVFVPGHLKWLVSVSRYVLICNVNLITISLFITHISSC